MKPVGTSFSHNSKYNTIAGRGASAVQFADRLRASKDTPENAKTSRKPVI